MWIQRGKGLADFNPELRRNAFGDIDGNIGLPCPAVIRRPDRANGWKRQFIGDKRVVGGHCCRKKSRASEAMTVRLGRRTEFAHRANEPKDQR